MSALPYASSRHGKRVHRLRGGSRSRFESGRTLACRSAVRGGRSGDCRDYLTRARDRTRQASVAVAETGTRTICNRGLRIGDRDSIPHRQPGCAFAVAVANSILQALSASVIAWERSAPTPERRALKCAARIAGMMNASSSSSVRELPEPDRLAYSVQEAADLLGIDYFSVYRLIQRGKLRACRALRGKLLVPRTELLRLLKT